MKKSLVFVLCTVVSIVIFVICLLNIGTTSELMSPPKLSGEYGDITDEIESKTGGKIILRRPKNTCEFSSVNIRDINSDSQNDAFVFYSPKSEPQKVYLCFLTQEDGRWSFKGTIQGEGSSVLDCACVDMDSDSVSEFIVGWRVNGSVSADSLCVYSVPKQSEKFKIYKCDSLPYAQYGTFSSSDDSRNELLVISNKYISSADKIPKASIYRLRSNKLFLVSSVSLKDKLTSYSKLMIDAVSGGANIYLDSVKEKKILLTKVLTYRNDKLSLTPSGKVSDLSRTLSSNICCEDINSDGKTEVPTEKRLGGKYNSTVTEWLAYESGTFNRKAVSYCDSDFIFMYPADWFDRVCVIKSSDDKKYVFKNIETGSELFTISKVSIAEVPEYESKGYKQLLIDNGSVYEIKTGNKSDNLSKTEQEIKSYIKTND